jgi:transposase
MFHPPSSPDLNPIESVWNELKKIIRRCPSTPTTLDELKKVILKAWEEILQEFVDRCVASMPGQTKAVLAAKGGHTKY